MTLHFITLLRHGESEGNRAGVLQGQYDYPLSQLGTHQAKALACDWKSNSIKYDLIISSPLTRASQTAEIISTYLKVPIEFEPAWMERNYGRLQGTRLADIETPGRRIDYLEPYFQFGENGENLAELYQRANMALQNLITLPDGEYLVVSHGGILNQAVRVAMHIDPENQETIPPFLFGNLGYAQLLYDSRNRQWGVTSLCNDTRIIPIQEVN
jgi:broad specificity phosphatase PhoE